jgi:hypothetical protein
MRIRLRLILALAFIQLLKERCCQCFERFFRRRAKNTGACPWIEAIIYLKTGKLFIGDTFYCGKEVNLNVGGQYDFFETKYYYYY